MGGLIQGVPDTWGLNKYRGLVFTALLALSSISCVLELLVSSTLYGVPYFVLLALTTPFYPAFISLWVARLNQPFTSLLQLLVARLITWAIATTRVSSNLVVPIGAR